ncbi:MAG: DUF2214 family protein [Pseudohongiella sp.]|uniref:DUF2214 family protein n=1 Tax=Pseudohongiella sp. TaxID=1979412 RepID=UPI0034A03784
MADAIFRGLHLFGALGMAAGLIIASLAAGSLANDGEQHPLAYQTFRRIYAYTALAALLSIAGGLMLWLAVGKPAAFFSNNPVFHAKLGLVMVLLVTLIYPAWCLCRPRGQNPLPRSLLRLQKSALPLLVIVPVLAYLMARGVGY